jgi:hypothetical protein
MRSHGAGATLVMLNQLLYHDGKNTRHTLLAHRDSFLPKVPGQVPGWASGNRPPLQSGRAVSLNEMAVSDHKHSLHPAFLVSL